ncbi:hypothetical protein P375_08160 [Gallibacterium genomosp. 2]|uniref:Uncharacterized protein n=3 Tax=Gallibacterium TaxID=155493 RepID=A0A0A2Z1Z2_9PAST|nr:MULTISPECIES: hypothetical protein [Gallibacterium]AEC18488.1 hypothetical protein UMN179_02481 [Gallibacterium anatis UMN179]KGQ31240.1 hypothetical protein P375_08160 [Gallibacterium genomosp. 2]KGQ43241.1 hypothetical protein JP28_09290 [Gallibacterium anatis]KGQ48810.1 hypothetical protein IO46_11445 [Gallibacterium anatis]KGQ51400.1 hypothetical protein JL12_03725 [Gallibacterium anatis 10672-6]
MANSNTEHSKKLRAKTAAAYNKKALEEGKVKAISLRLDADLATEFDAVLSELASTRPQGIKKLCEIYRNLKKD